MAHYLTNNKYFPKCTARGGLMKTECGGWGPAVPANRNMAVNNVINDAFRGIYTHKGERPGWEQGKVGKIFCGR